MGIQNESDGYVNIEVELEDKDVLTLAKEADRRGMTLNSLISEILFNAALKDTMAQYDSVLKNVKQILSEQSYSDQEKISLIGDMIDKEKPFFENNEEQI